MFYFEKIFLQIEGIKILEHTLELSPIYAPSHPRLITPKSIQFYALQIQISTNFHFSSAEKNNFS